MMVKNLPGQVHNLMLSFWSLLGSEAVDWEVFRGVRRRRKRKQKRRRRIRRRRGAGGVNSAYFLTQILINKCRPLKLIAVVG